MKRIITTGMFLLLVALVGLSQINDLSVISTSENNTFDNKKTEKFVFINYENNSQIRLSDYFLNNILDLQLKRMGFIRKNDFNAAKNEIIIKFSKIEVSDNQTEQKRTTESMLYSNQGCMKRNIKYTCELIENIQRKKAYFEGTIVFKNGAEQIMKVEKFSVIHWFKYSSFSKEGNEKGLSGLSRSKLNSNPAIIDFPTDNELIEDSKSKLKIEIQKRIKKNRNLF